MAALRPRLSLPTRGSRDEAFRRELAAQKRAMIEFSIGQTAMFVFVCLGLLGTL
jgi:hypothetical protein